MEDQSLEIHALLFRHLVERATATITSSSYYYYPPQYMNTTDLGLFLKKILIWSCRVLVVACVI